MLPPVNDIFKIMKSAFIISFFCLTLVYGQKKEDMVFFKTGKTELTKRQKTRISYILSKFDSNTLYDLTIKGYADSYGGDNVNRKLSKTRVDNVYNFIIDYGLKFEHIQLLPFGEIKAEENYAHHSHSQYDRRVEFHLESTGKKVPQKVLNKEKAAKQVLAKKATKNVKKTYKFDKDGFIAEEKVELPHIRELYEKVKFKRQAFHIRTGSNVFIKCKEGSVVYIPKESFETEDRKVKVVLTENIKPSNWVVQSYSDNLNLDAHNELVESFYFKAYDSSGKEIHLKRNKAISLMIPTKDIDKEINLISSSIYQEDESIEKINIHDFKISDYVDFDRKGRIDLSSKKIKKEFENMGKLHKPVIEEVMAVGDSIIFGDVYLESIKKTSSQILVSAFDVYHFEKTSQFEDKKNVPLLKRLRVLYPNLKKNKLDYEDIRHFEFLKKKGEEIRYDQLRYYSLEITNPGWTFLGKKKKVFNPSAYFDVTVNLKPEKNIDVKLISKKTGTVIHADDEEEEIFKFKNVPKNDKFQIVAVKYLPGGKVELATKYVVGVQKAQYDVEFKESSKESFRIFIKGFDHFNTAYSF